MPILSDILTLKSRDLVNMRCDGCKTTFQRPKNKVQRGLKHYTEVFCSSGCNSRTRMAVGISIPCKTCSVLVPIHQRKRMIRDVFCSNSCSAKYHNSHKSFGIRRSKLEAFIEGELRKDFSHLKLLCNDQSFGFELDFYFPTLRFAIELNGVVHYEPIYGSDRLTRIKINDNSKMARCRELGIELAVVDASSCRRFDKQKEIYYSIVHELVQSIAK